MSSPSTLSSRLNNSVSLFHFCLVYRRYDEDDKAAWQCGSWCEYIFVTVLSAILLLAAIVLTVFWIIYYKSGYSLEDKSKLWNFHPTLMIAGYITLSGFCKLCANIIADQPPLMSLPITLFQPCCSIASVVAARTWLSSCATRFSTLVRSHASFSDSWPSGNQRMSQTRRTSTRYIHGSDSSHSDCLCSNLSWDSSGNAWHGFGFPQRRCSQFAILLFSWSPPAVFSSCCVVRMQPRSSARQWSQFTLA